MNGTGQEKAFLGVGWAFPVCLQPDGQIETVAFEEDIRQAIRILLGTNPGERVMRPDFGAGLNAFVFESLSETVRQRVKTRVENSLIHWEPRIDVQDQGRDRSLERNKLLIHIHYRVRATNSLSNLVYPFYLQEGTPR